MRNKAFIIFAAVATLCSCTTTDISAKSPSFDALREVVKNNEGLSTADFHPAWMDMQHPTGAPLMVGAKTLEETLGRVR